MLNWIKAHPWFSATVAALLVLCWWRRTPEAKARALGNTETTDNISRSIGSPLDTGSQSASIPAGGRNQTGISGMDYG
jgi:hypothetical protein